MVDIIILLPLLWGAYSGYRRGLLSEIVSLLHFIIAFVICFKIIGFIFRLTSQYLFVFHQDTLAQLALASSFVATILLLNTVVSKYLKTEIEFDFPGAWDNIIGAIFGMAKFAVLVSFLFWFSTAFGTMRPKLTDKAMAYPVIESIAPKLLGVNNAKELNAVIRDAL